MVVCREAARKATAFAEDGTYMETKEPLRLPAFEKVIGFAVQKALEDWRDEALEGEHLHQAAWSDVSTCSFMIWPVEYWICSMQICCPCCMQRHQGAAAECA